MEYSYQFEEWRDIPEYFGLYQISNFGRVRSIGYGKERILKQRKDKDGYLIVNLWKDGKVKTFKVHRLVALAFLPNPDNLPQVNHKNEDKTDNRVENLEWCSAKYNINYGTCIKRRAEKQSKSIKGVFINRSDQSKPVAQFTKEGTLIGIYPSTAEAERQGFQSSHIASCCRGERKTHKGYLWKWG